MNLNDKIRTQQFMIDQEGNRIQFNDTRFYYHEKTGDFYPSVTTILGLAYPKDPQFYEWLKQNGEDSDKIRDAAGVHGSLVHKLTEEYDAGLQIVNQDEKGNPKYFLKEWSQFERYVEFSERFQPEIEHIEVNMVSPKYRVGGTLDRILKMELTDKKTKVKKRLLLDIKTSNMLHDTYWLQLSVYRNMWLEAHPGEKIDDVCILWLNAKTRTEGKGDAIQGIGWQLVFPDEPLEAYEQDWEATRRLFDRKFGDMKPKNLTYQLSYQKKVNEAPKKIKEKEPISQ